MTRDGEENGGMEEGRRREGDNETVVPVQEYDMMKPTTLYTEKQQKLLSSLQK